VKYIFVVFLVIGNLTVFAQTTDSLSLDLGLPDDTLSFQDVNELSDTSRSSKDTISDFTNKSLAEEQVSSNLDSINNSNNPDSSDVETIKNESVNLDSDSRLEVLPDGTINGNNYFTTINTTFSDTVLMEFIKTNVTQSPDSLYFNVLKIVNYKSKSISGELTFTAPTGWNIISAQGNIINLDSSDSAFIPIRLAIDNEVVGAFTYMLNATFKTDDEIFSGNAYITIPGKRYWDMGVDKSIVVFNQYYDNEDLQIKISNKGNTTETIKLEYKVGALLLVEGVDEFSSSSYITLQNNKDTLVKVRVKFNNSLSYDEQQQLSQNWKESSVEIIASTFDKKIKKSIWFKKLKSSYVAQELSASPLNVSVTLSDLLSGQNIRLNTQVFGAILFPEDHNFSYSVNLMGFGLESNLIKDFDFNRRLRYTFIYQHDKLLIRAGNNIAGGGYGVGYTGYGFIAKYKIDKTSNLSLGATRANSYNAYSGFVRYSKKIFKIGLRTGLSVATNPSSNQNAYSASVGASFPLLKLNSFSFDVYKLSTSLSTFFENDTLSSGFGYNLGYSFHYKKFNFAVNYRDYMKFARKIGQQIVARSGYQFKNNLKLIFQFDRRKSFYDISKYNLDTKSLYSINDFGRITFNIHTNNSISYGIGPQYASYIRQSLENSTLFISTTKTYNPKIYLSVNKSISKRKSISVYLTTGLSYINYNTEDPSIAAISMKNKGTYSFGSTYNTKYWRLTVGYNMGSVTDMWSYLNYHMMFPNYDIESVMTESIVLRPYYERAIFNNKGRTQFMANYTYYMPSGRENLTLSSVNYFFLNNGWSASINANMYMGSVVDKEYGRITTKNINVQLGVKKSFDIQQPRLKFYDLNIICFNDLNGNKIKDENEPPLPNIQISFERLTVSDDMDEQNVLKTNFALVELVTSPDGETFYGNIPQGRYKVQFFPLFNMHDLYNVNGNEQTVVILSDNTTLFVPYAETYKLKGRVIVERDEFSSEGNVLIEGIRVTATNSIGESYSALTDKNGDYVLSVPQAQTYVVKVNNVFGEQFMCEKDEYSVHFNGIKVIKLDFKFIEKKRKVNFNSNIDQFYIFKSLSTSQVPSDIKKGVKNFDADIDTSAVLNYVDVILDTQNKLNKPKASDVIPISKIEEEGIVFKVQLFSESSVKKTYGDFKSFPKVTCIDGETGGFIYLVGSYTNYEQVKNFLQDVQDLGFGEAKIVPFKDSLKISLQEAGVENE